MMVKRRSSTGPSTRQLPPSTRNRPPPSPLQNLLLAALPEDEYQRILPTLEVVSIKLKDILQKPGEALHHVYFPVGGFCSVVTVLQDGSMVEVATIGREGMVGISAVLDGGPVPSASMVQAESSAWYRMTTDAFRRELDQRGTFYELLMRYAQAHMGFVMQSTACNAVHSVEQRLARWLLLAQDRVEKNDFPLTQEFVAMMLGATRPTVTLVAGTLQRAGLITYHRGHVTIVDRRGLERASCECYRTATSLLQAVTARSRAAPRSRRALTIEKKALAHDTPSVS
jgi:CRP-like cAMP-binding protein